MYFNDRLGRKLSIMFSAIPSIFGYLLMGSAQDVWMLLVGRLLTGFAGGVTSASIPVRKPQIKEKNKLSDMVVGLLIRMLTDLLNRPAWSVKLLYHNGPLS